MSYMKVDHIFCVSPLHTDRKRFARMEREGDQSPSGRRHILTQHACIDLKFQQTGISGVESEMKKA